MVHSAPLFMLLLLLASTASAETIWLRGRGEDVWIEWDGRAREPRDDRKGFTRVATPKPGASAARRAPRSSVGGVVLGPPHWRHHPHAYDGPYWYGHHYRHAPRYPHARHRYRDHYPRRHHHRHSVRGGDRHGQRGGGTGAHRGSRALGGVRGAGFVSRGGAYRRR